MASVRQHAAWAAVLAVVLLATPAGAQGNIDAGKTPAQIFSDTCAGCHRSARELRRASASFLRTHYTTGSQEASTMANYLANVPNDARGTQPKRPPAEAGKQNGRQPQPVEQPGSQRGQAKGNRTTAQVPPTAAEEKPLEPPTAVEPEPMSPPPPPPPALEPFDE